MPFYSYNRRARRCPKGSQLLLAPRHDACFPGRLFLFSASRRFSSSRPNQTEDLKNSMSNALHPGANYIRSFLFTDGRRSPGQARQGRHPKFYRLPSPGPVHRTGPGPEELLTFGCKGGVQRVCLAPPRVQIPPTAATALPRAFFCLARPHFCFAGAPCRSLCQDRPDPGPRSERPGWCKGGGGPAPSFQ